MRWVLGCVVVAMSMGCVGLRPWEPLAGRQLDDAQTAYEEAVALYSAGRYAEALARAGSTLATREALLGADHPEVAHSLNLLGELYRLKGDSARAQACHERALAIREAAVDADTLAAVTGPRLLAFASAPEMDLERHPGATAGPNNAFTRRAGNLYGPDKRLRGPGLASQQATLSENQAAVAESLNNLANLFQDRGQYAKAEPLYERALRLLERVLGGKHPSVADALNNLALVYRQQGLYAKAEPLYVRALDIREAALGARHPELAFALDNLATLYQDQGLYGRAEPLYERALALREAALGREHASVADSLNNLANLYQEQGLYDRAEPLYTRAIALQERAADGSPVDLATSLNNLASLYLAQGRGARAEPLYERALKLWEASLGAGHPHVAALLNNLATLYRDQGRYDRAEPLYLRALKVWEATLGPGHPDVAGLLNNLATLYRDQGRYDRAEPLYARALSLRETVLGADHPDLAVSLNNLALLRLAQHRLDAAVPLLARAFAVSEQRLRREALDFSEARLSTFLQLLRADEERLYALARAHPESESVRRLALSAALLLKGRSVEETADISRAVYQGLGAPERGTFEELRGLRTQLASLSLQGPGSLTLPAWRQQLEHLVRRGDALEAALARGSAPLRALGSLPTPGDIVDRVAASLPADGALVEFVTYEDRPLVPGPAGARSQPRCLALVLLPDARVRVLDLGPVGPIEAAAASMRDALARRDADFQAPARQLHQLAFGPLLPLLGGARRVFLAPDGQLAMVPFAALHDGQGFLVDAWDFTYLTSGKDLLPRSAPSRPASSVVVLADPAFDTSVPRNPPLLAQAHAWAERTTPLERGGLTDRGWNLVPLPGSREEAEAIQRLIPDAQLFLGREATKERLLHVPTPGILHLATHGFFLEDAAAPENTRAVAHFGALGRLRSR